MEKEKDILAPLRKDYKIRNEKEVADFLNQHKDLLPILEEAPPIIRKYFPK